MRRHLIVALACILAGAACSITVAWACSWKVGSDWAAPQVWWDDPRTSRVTAQELEWLQSRGVEAAADSDCIRCDILVAERRRCGIYQRALQCYSVRIGDCDMTLPWHVGPHGLFTEAGWPIRCLRDRLSPPKTFPSGVTHDSGLLVPSALRKLFKVKTQYLPVGIIPLGLTLDTLIYAAAVWILCCFPARLRSLIRLRAGRCASCGYPWGDRDRCSECGVPYPRPGTTGPHSAAFGGNQIA